MQSRIFAQGSPRERQRGSKAGRETPLISSGSQGFRIQQIQYFEEVTRQSEATVNADAHNEVIESKGTSDEKVDNDKIKDEEAKGEEVELTDVFCFQKCTDTAVGSIPCVLRYAKYVVARIQSSPPTH